MGYEPDPDALRWGLHDLEVCTLTNAGSCSSVTRYESGGAGTQGYVREGYNQPLTGYVDNDAAIAQFYQDELSRVARAEASGLNNLSPTSVVAQEWPHPHQGGFSKVLSFYVLSMESLFGKSLVYLLSAGQENQGEAIDISRESDILHNHNGNMEDKNVARIRFQGGQSSPPRDDDSVCSVEIEEESWSEVGKRLNQMIPIAVSSFLCEVF